MSAAPECGCGRRSSLQPDEERLESFQGTNAGTLVVRRVNDLSRHPAYARLNLTVASAQLSAIEELGDFAFRDPLLITRGGVIIDGYARWELAMKQRVSTLLCVEFDVDEEEALRRILKRHRRSSGWNDYNRICMASQLKDVVRRRARDNQSAGGHFKGLSKLTEANVRKEIARAAGVCEGNVTKVDQLSNADPAVLDALASGEIRIHRAWLWRELAWQLQRERLRQYRLRELKQRASMVAHQHRANRKEAALTLMMPADLGHLIQRLSALRLGDSLDSELIPIVQIDGLGPAIFLTTELYELFSHDCSLRKEHI